MSSCIELGKGFVSYYVTRGLGFRISKKIKISKFEFRFPLQDSRRIITVDLNV